ncbi:MAG: tyrosine-type recombinase/integrase [Gemmataceae bacterium]
MPRKKNSSAGHTGRTTSGHTRDVKVERIGKITIYKRGDTYFLYYRQGGVTQRRKVDGNLAVARATAHKVGDAVAENRPSPLAYSRTSPDKMVEGFLDAVANVKKLALRTQDRYRAALDRFLDFCKTSRIATVDAFEQATVEDFVKWLRGQKRSRNGAVKGRKAAYQEGGIKFILSTCRTAFNWAARRRMLPPFTENPFTRFPIEELGGVRSAGSKEKIFSPEQERAFFAAANTWQKNIFSILALYGLRVGELTHLLVEDIDWERSILTIQSKPELFWAVKTGANRMLPLLPETKAIFERVIGGRKAGFVFLNEDYVLGKAKPSSTYLTPASFRAKVEQVAAELLAADPDADERAQRRAVVSWCRSMGQIPEKRIRCEFMSLTAQIGCPEFTRVHDLRHLFSSRAQAAGINQILVQEMLGHTTLEMTRRYTHLGMETKREALQRLAEDQPGAGNKENVKNVQETPREEGSDKADNE